MIIMCVYKASSRCMAKAGRGGESVIALDHDAKTEITHVNALQINNEIGVYECQKHQVQNLQTIESKPLSFSDFIYVCSFISSQVYKSHI